MHLFYLNGTAEAPLPAGAILGKLFRTAGMTVQVDVGKNKVIVLGQNGKRLAYPVVPGSTRDTIDFPELPAEFGANKLRSSGSRLRPHD